MRIPWKSTKDPGTCNAEAYAFGVSQLGGIDAELLWIFDTRLGHSVTLPHGRGSETLSEPRA
jgi:hypothetical protein